jgi:hypothetical protein
MSKIYLLFEFPEYYPAGGMGDCYAICKTEEGAKEARAILGG